MCRWVLRWTPKLKIQKSSCSTSFQWYLWIPGTSQRIIRMKQNRSSKSSFAILLCRVWIIGNCIQNPKIKVLTAPGLSFFPFFMSCFPFLTFPFYLLRLSFAQEGLHYIFTILPWHGSNSALLFNDERTNYCHNQRSYRELIYLSSPILFI